VLPLVALFDGGYRVRCPACETQWQLVMAEGLEADRAWVGGIIVPTFEKQSLRVGASRGSDRPAAPFVVHLPAICELYVADVIERLIRSLPTPRQIILDVASLKELSARAADRLVAVAESLQPEEVLIAQYKKSDAPPPFAWPQAIRLVAESKEAHEACAAAGPPPALIVSVVHK
jgi:hypothetical protein